MVADKKTDRLALLLCISYSALTQFAGPQEGHRVVKTCVLKSSLLKLVGGEEIEGNQLTQVHLKMVVKMEVNTIASG